MLEGKLNESVFERLSKKIKEKTKEVEDISVVSATAPIITLHRGAPISVALFDLAKIQNQKKIS